MTTRASDGIDPRLCLMMFLQYSIIGVFAPILPSYLEADLVAGGLGFSGYQIGWILAIAPAMGSISAPFIAGQFADRYVSGERYLAAALIVSGVAQWLLADQRSFAAWAALSIVFSLGFYPTISLTNALTMAHLPDARRQFASVRLWGTVGWIFVGWAFSVLFLQQSIELRALPPFFGGEERPDAIARIAVAIRASAVISFACALCCLFLPHTPPNRAAKDRLAFVSACRLLRRRSIVVLILVSLVLTSMDRIVFLQTAPYLQSIGVRTSHVMPAMAVGQVGEILVMLFLGTLLPRFGFRTILIAGALCYLLRFAVFATPGLPIALIVASQLLHGVCFACGLTVITIYVDRLAPADARHSAQSGFTLAAMAPGAVLGGLLNGFLASTFSAESGRIDYSSFWYSCAGISLIGFLGLACFFRDESAS